MESVLDTGSDPTVGVAYIGNTCMHTVLDILDPHQSFEQGRHTRTRAAEAVRRKSRGAKIASRGAVAVVVL